MKVNCLVGNCINNKGFICEKEKIKINAFGKCVSYRNKNIPYKSVRETDFNKLPMSSFISKHKMMVVK